MNKREEFPELTANALAAYVAGCTAAPFEICVHTFHRRAFAAFLLEAMKQARHACLMRGVDTWEELERIADNLYSPPPPPPTLAQAREAARQLGGENAAIVHAFLATLGEGVQP
jgi:hypothetical protein